MTEAKAYRVSRPRVALFIAINLLLGLFLHYAAFEQQVHLVVCLIGAFIIGLLGSRPVKAGDPDFWEVEVKETK